MLLRAIIAAVLLLCACNGSLPCGGRLHPDDQGLHYSIDPTAVSPEGIRVDAPVGYDLTLIDRVVDEVDACLATVPPMTEAERGIPVCPNVQWSVPIPRGCLVVKVAPWIPSCDGTMQLLDEPADELACAGKVFTPTCAKRQCHYRAGLQGEVVVTTPNLMLVKDPLVRLATGCAYPWNSAALGRCMQPTPRPDGPSDAGAP